MKSLELELISAPHIYRDSLECDEHNVSANGRFDDQPKVKSIRVLRPTTVFVSIHSTTLIHNGTDEGDGLAHH